VLGHFFLVYEHCLQKNCKNQNPLTIF